jgi:AcrR family transcriptional regulator
MPAKGDHDARREDVSEAVWQVLARCGVGGLTIRSVAAELGATTGLVRHYFPSKKALVAHARQVAEDRSRARERLTPDEPGLAALKVAVLDVLPLTPDMIAMSKAWVSFWDASIGDPDLGTDEQRRYQSWRTQLRQHVVVAQQRGELCATVDPDDYAVIIGSFAHGLVVQSLFDAQRFSPARQRRLVEMFFAQVS